MNAVAQKLWANKNKQEQASVNKSKQEQARASTSKQEQSTALGDAVEYLQCIGMPQASNVNEVL